LITQAKAQELLDILHRDCENFERNENWSLFDMMKVDETFGLIIPLDWVETWCPEAEEAWTHYMSGKTFCEYGYYLCDVTRFLRSKAGK